MSVLELVDMCEISQSQMSQFLSRMKAEGLVQCRRDGTYQYYSLADKKLEELLKFLHATYCP
jgi:DNA-binding transcriptional ArsR family regulator